MKNDPLEEVLREIQIVLEKAQENAEKPLKQFIPPEAEARLAKLENAMAAYLDKLQKEAQENNMDMKALEEGAFRMPPGLTERQQKVWIQAAKLRWDAEGMKLALSRAKKELEEPHVMQQSPSGKKRAVVKRRSKFKKMGGDKWKKM